VGHCGPPAAEANGTSVGFPMEVCYGPTLLPSFGLVPRRHIDGAAGLAACRPVPDVEQGCGCCSRRATDAALAIAGALCDWLCLCTTARDGWSDGGRTAL